MVKLNWTIDYTDVMEVKIEDQVFHVSKMIPHDQKVAMAEEYVQLVVIIDDNGLATYRDDAPVLAYLKAKYYTDIDVDDVMLGMVHDYWIRHDIDSVIAGRVHGGGDLHERDFDAARDMCRYMADSVVAAWKTKFSLASLMNGVFDHQIKETIEKSNLVNNEMIDLLDKAKSPAKPEVKVAQFPDFAKKNT